MRKLTCLVPGLLLPLLHGCCPLRPPATPFSQTTYGRAVVARGVTAACGRNVLAALTPLERSKLRQLMFIANLQLASGNERSPLKLLRRVQRELAEPVVITRATAARVLAELESVVRSLPRDGLGRLRPMNARQGWAAVKRMLTPAQGTLPTTAEALRRIVALWTSVHDIGSVVSFYRKTGYV